MSDPTCPAPDELTFGAALAELDQVVAALEGGQLELEESIERYGRGVALLQALQSKLSDAQQKVTMLIGELESEAGDGQAGATSSSEPTPAPASSGTEEIEIPF
jgi:exodeoxyribonuclease VII small subunit